MIAIVLESMGIFYMRAGSRILGAAGRLESLVVFGPFWPLEVSIGTKIYIEL